MAARVFMMVLLLALVDLLAWVAGVVVGRRGLAQWNPAALLACAECRRWR